MEKSPSPVYGARLELVYGLIAHRGFESLLLRHKSTVILIELRWAFSVQFPAHAGYHAKNKKILLTNGASCCIITKLLLRQHEASKRMEKSRSWPSAHDWKSCIPQKGIEGSNPSFSAKKNPILADRVFFLAEIRRRDLNNQMQVSGGHLLNAAGKHSHLSVPNSSFSAVRTKAEIMPHARPGMGQIMLRCYFAERSTALRSME